MKPFVPHIWKLPFVVPKKLEGNKVLLALGSSLGNRQANLQRGIQYLMQDPASEVVKLSSVWQTMPIGAAKNSFFNMCLILNTVRSPASLLQHLMEIERRCDRLRGVHWMDRTLDLDILLYESEVIKTPSLQIPHSRMLERNFVMLPAVEVASDWPLPNCGLSLSKANLHSRLGMWKVGRFVIAKKASIQYQSKTTIVRSRHENIFGYRQH